MCGRGLRRRPTPMAKYADRAKRDAEIVRRASAGEFQVDIARDLGLTGARVNQIALAAGVRIGKRTRAPKGKDARTWRGGTRMAGKYLEVFRPDHPRADGGGYVLAHILLAEAALGKPLPSGAQVHHATGDPSDNRHLVICPDQHYHQLLHRRMRAKAACGNPDWVKCKFCKRWDAPVNLQIVNSRWLAAYHRECEKAYREGRRRK